MDESETMISVAPDDQTGRPSMNQEAALAERASLPDRRAAAEGRAGTRVRGYWLLSARSLWLAAGALALGIFVASLPVRWAQLTTPCLPGTGCAPWQLSPDDWRALAGLGLSPRGYAASVLGLVVTGAAISATIGALIFWRRSGELPALFVSLTLVVYGTQSNTDALLAARPDWAFAIRALGALAWSCLWLFLFTFPDGRFVPGWTRAPAAIAVATETLHAVPGDWPLAPSRWPGPLGAALTLGILGTALFALVYRYRRVSTPVQRQQTKWLVFGFGVALALGIVLAALSFAFPPETHTGPAWTLLDAASSV